MTQTDYYTQLLYYLVLSGGIAVISTFILGLIVCLYKMFHA